MHASTIRSPEARSRADEMLQRAIPTNNFRHALFQPLVLRRIQVEGSKAIFEVETINHDAFAVGKRIGGDDFHAPSRQGSGEGRKKKRLVSGYNRELVEIAISTQGDLHRFLPEPRCKFEVADDWLCAVDPQVALRQPFEEWLKVRNQA